MSAITATFRGLLSDHPVKALAETDSSDPLARDYVAAHLSIPLEQWERRQEVAKRSLEIGAATEWSDNLLDGVPDIVLHKFTCDCAVRALVREKKAGRDPDKRSWAAITAMRRWLRGEITDEELYSAWEAAREAAMRAAWAAREASKNAAMCAASAAERQWQIQRLSLLCGRYALGRIRGRRP